MEGKSHDTRSKEQHKKPGLPTPSAMQLLGGIVEEEDCIFPALFFELPTTTSDTSGYGVIPAKPQLPPIQTTRLAPPVTRNALMEMEKRMRSPPVSIVHEMIYEGKLNLNLDQLRPARTSKEEKTYWDIITHEWMQLSTKKSAPNLSFLLDEIQTMLVHLYSGSQSVRDFYAVGLTGDFIVNELSRGTMDVSTVALKLKQLFQENCAPKRDILVQTMYLEGSRGDLVRMLRISLDLMELMKMDLLSYYVKKSRKQLFMELPERERSFLKPLLDRSTVKTENFIREAHQAIVNGLVGKLQTPNDTCQLVAMALSLLLTNVLRGALPETLSLDVLFVEETQRGFESVCILGVSFIVARNWIGKDKSIMNELKTRLYGLLGFPGSRMDDIANQIALLASRKRGQPLSGDERAVLRNSVDKIVHPQHPIYMGVKRRLGSSLTQYILDGRFCTAEIHGAGLAPLAEELESMFGACKRLWVHHWTVHKERYQLLLQ